MAIAFGSIVSSSTPAHPLALTPNGSAGSFLLWGAVNDNTTDVTFTSPSGFTQDGDLFINSSDKGSLYVGHKANASGSEGSLSLSNSNSSLMIGFVLYFTGVDTSTPLDVAVVTAQTNAAGGPPIAQDSNITPVTDGARIVQVVISDVTSSDDASIVFSTQSGTTDAWTTHGDFNSGFYNVHVGSANQTTSGALTVRASSSGVATRAIGVVTLALRPTAGGVVTIVPYILVPHSGLFIQGIR